MRRLVGLALTLGLSASSMVFASSASAGGPNVTCGLNFFCVSKYPNPAGSTSTSMTHGWRGYAPNAAWDDMANDTYSNSGGTVAKNIYSIRNRDNINGRMFCTGQKLSVGNYLVVATANFYTQHWVPVYSNWVQYTVATWKGPSSSTCL